MLQTKPGILPMFFWFSFGNVIDDIVRLLLVLIHMVLHLSLLIGLHQRISPIAEGISLVLYFVFGQIGDVIASVLEFGFALFDY